MIKTLDFFILYFDFDKSYFKMSNANKIKILAQVFALQQHTSC